MAKKTRKSSKLSSNSEKLTMRNFILGMVLIFFGGFILVSIISFVFTGGADRSFFDMSFFELVGNSDLVVRNIMGKFGAWISDMLVTNGVGIFSLAVPAVIFAFAFHLFGIKSFSIKRFLWRCFLLVAWGSVVLGFLFFGISDRFYPLIGGAYGYFAAKWLMLSFGAIGTFMLLALLLLIYLSLSVSSFQMRIISLVERLSKNRIHLPKISIDPVESFSDDENENNDEDNEEISEDIETQQDTEENNDNEELTIVRTADKEKENIESKENQQVAAIEAEQSGTFTIAETVIDEGDGINRGSLDTPYDPTLELSNYKYPTLDLLTDYQTDNDDVAESELYENKNKIEQTLNNFSIKIQSIKATVGPTVTLYEIVPAPGVRISKIQSLENDIALSLSALGIRIIAPIPGKGTIGIEVPNSKPQIVSMYSVIKSNKFQTSTYELPVALGKTISNETFVIDLAKTPHLLVAGATGQGKSVGLNAIITSLLYKKHPSQVKLVMVDPKMVEFSIYRKLEKHFLAKMPNEEDAIITDVEKVKSTLNSLTIEMDDRYALLQKVDLRNIKEYNKKFINRQLNPEHGHRFLPYIVVVIDEFADLIMMAGKEVETPIARIAQKARAVGIHMILATQRPSTNIITGVIKANFPSRIAFKVSSMVDSRTILDTSGAQHLIGRGDMLVSMDSATTRVQCAFVDTDEVMRINDYISAQQGYFSAYELPESSQLAGDEGFDPQADVGKLDSLFKEVAQMVVSTQAGSTSNIQRRFSLGYNRAGKLMDQLERFGIVGPAEGSKPRTVLVQTEMDLERIFAGLGI